MKKQKENLLLIPPDVSSHIEIPLAECGVSAGFPSPAEDFLESPLDLNKTLIRNPAATFFVRVDGESMKDDCICHGDLLVVDKSVEPYSNCVAVCYLQGEFTLKRVQIENNKIILVPANEKYPSIEVIPDDEFTVWGVVKHVIKSLK